MTTYRLTNWGSGIQAADPIADNDYKRWQKARNTAEPTLCFICGLEYPISTVLYSQVTNVIENQENMDFQDNDPKGYAIMVEKKFHNWHIENNVEEVQEC